MSEASPTRRRPIVAIALIAFAGCLVIGSIAELVGALVPSVFPDGGAALAELHRSRVVASWVVVQNLVTLPLGVVIAFGVRGTLRGIPAARTMLRRAGWALITTIVASQLVLGFALYPELLSSADPAQGLAWMLALVGAGAGVAAMGMVAVFFARP